jgi:toxin ParE1/3/4
VAGEVEWTEVAFRDLAQAAEYIGGDSPTYAAVLVAGADKAAQSLRNFPERGKIVPEYKNQQIRQLYVGSYRLIYRVDSDKVQIIAFVHGARDLARFAEQRGTE